MSISKASKFQKGSGCFTCTSCGKKTRATAEGNEGCDLCPICFERSGDENMVSDGLMTQAEFDARWNQPKPTRKPRAKILPMTQKRALEINKSIDAVKENTVERTTAEVTTIEEQPGDGTIVSTEPSSLPVVETSTIDFVTLGMSVALADLANARGMNVSDVITLPERLASAGLPIDIHGAIIARAVKIQRDEIDAMLWRNNPTARSLAARLANGVRPAEILAVSVADVKRVEPKQIAAVVTETPVVPVIAPVTTQREPKPQVKRTSAFGHAGVAIARWLGKNDVSLKDAVAALARVGITHLSEATIKVNLNGGKAGRYGGAPELTQEQVNELLGK